MVAGSHGRSRRQPHRANAAQGSKRAGNDLNDNARIHSLPFHTAASLIPLEWISRVQDAVGVSGDLIRSRGSSLRFADNCLVPLGGHTIAKV